MKFKFLEGSLEKTKQGKLTNIRIQVDNLTPEAAGIADIKRVECFSLEPRFKKGQRGEPSLPVFSQHAAHQSVSH